jgi:hypothetical protein
MKYTFFLLNLLFSRTALIFNLLFILILCVRLPMQKIIQIYPCLLKLLRQQDTILNIGDFSTKI